MADMGQKSEETCLWARNEKSSDLVPNKGVFAPEFGARARIRKKMVTGNGRSFSCMQFVCLALTLRLMLPQRTKFT